MSVNRTECIEQVIHLPARRTPGGKSAYDLLKKCGYFKLANDIGKDDIRRAVQEYPYLIKEWYAFSADKKEATGWTFTTSEPGKFCVFYVPFNEHLKDEIYTNESEACAAFIKHEIDAIKARGK